jgi:ATP synthase protein I
MNQTPEELGRKIKEARARDGEKQASVPGKAANGSALRAATDLVAGVFVGGFLGYWIDRWIGSKPWGMVILLLLGFTAGFLNIYRAQTGQDFKTGFKKDKKE